ncbi:MAG: S8 family serine peptidase [Rubrivivax sp.]|nr:S8 family serine peptidase [Rubrivivax sp.]
MKQHDDDAAPSEVPRPRRRGTASRPAWPFPSGSLTPQGGEGSGIEPSPEPECPRPTRAPTERRRARWTHVFTLVAGAFVLHGCGGGGGGDSGPAPAPAKPPTAQAGSVSLDVLGAAPSTVTGKVSASDPQGLALTYTVTNAPSAGTVTVDARSGSFSYTVAGQPAESQDSFTVAVSNGQAAAVSAVVTVQLKSDPLLVNQWHIRNTGASAFSTVLPVAGNDMNVAGAWAAGYSGKGIKVGVLDTGLQISHEDLAANVDAASSFNFLTGRNDPTLDAAVAGGDHGTMVAGIIGAAAFNGKGGRGVAYNARLRGYNYLASGQTVVNYGDAMGGKPMSSDNAVFNQSFGTIAPKLFPPSQAFIDVDRNLARLRDGLGAVLVKSAGNSFLDFDDEDADPTLCDLAKKHGVSCGNPAQSPTIGAPTPIVVGALNAEGKRASYSNTGSALWVAAPGGEYGVDSTQRDVSGSANAANLVKPAIVTTARESCDHRKYAPGFANGLTSGSHPVARNCQYTATMNGTSSAAPNVSATVALMLEANPRLSARDVKDILAKTARRVDPSLAPVTSTDLAPAATITLEQGWVRNAAGFWFSNAYGFGGVDAAAAVAMAKGYTSTLPAQQASPMLRSTPRAGAVVPADSAAGLEFSLQTNSFTFETVEQVVISFHFDETPSLWCNQVEVTSPAGTKSILLHAASGYEQTSVAGTALLTNAFYGEPVKGTWKFKFLNFCAGRTLLSATQGQGIQFYGR